MAKQDGRSYTLFGDMHSDAIGVDDAVGRLAHRSATGVTIDPHPRFLGLGFPGRFPNR